MESHLVTRRRFVSTSAGLAASAGFAGLLRPAGAAETLTAVEWGGPWLAASKALLADQHQFDVDWVLHVGSASTIVTKIKAALPKWNYDVIHSFPPVTYVMMNEGWLEPLDVESMPNLKNIPEPLLMRDAKGNVVNCPTGQLGAYWGVRTDLVQKKIQKAEDLLDPSLKGKILFLHPTLQSARLLVSLALERGGNERNINPGFEFAKELAKSGNVGRVAKSDVEIINSLNTGETAIGFTQMAGWAQVTKDHPVDRLIYMPQSHEMFRIFGSQEEWALLKGSPKKQAAKEFMNWYIDAANNDRYAAQLGYLPVNRLAKPSPDLSFISAKNDEDRKTYWYFPDYPFISQQIKAWTERWENEIAPLF